MAIITDAFIDNVLRTGPFAEAQARTVNGTARPRNQAKGDEFSTWALICEETVDTEYPSGWYDDVVAELARRGFSPEQVDRMWRFAWQTAGWLNFDKMLWDWVSLDEKDIKLALDWQLKGGLISRGQYDEAFA